jgi:hypothetical protein
MKKKSIIFISVISSILLGIGITAIVLSGDTFSFSNLTVDIGDSEGLGIGKIANDSRSPSGRRYQSSGNPQAQSNYDKLVKVDEEGNVDILRFYNTNGNNIEIPFHAILIENYGEFGYMVFSNWSLEYQDKIPSIFNGIGTRHTFHSYFAIASSMKKNNEFGLIGYKFEYEFIAIHKNSGKVFDLGESIINKTDLDNYSNLRNLRLLYLPNGFSFTTSFKNNTETCINRGLFNPLTNSIDMTIICSPLLEHFSANQLALPNGNTYMGDGKVFNLYNFNLSDSRGYEMLLSGTHTSLFISTERISWRNYSTGNNIHTLDFDGDGNIINYSVEENIILRLDADYSDYYRNPYSSAPFLQLDLIEIDNITTATIYEFYPETGEVSLRVEINFQDYIGELVYFEKVDMFSFNNSIFLILGGAGNTEFIEVDSIDFSFVDYYKIEHAGSSTKYYSEVVKNPNYFLFGYEFYESNAFITFKRTGNFYYSIIENLTIRTMKYNIYTKETYEETESTPTFSYFEITPIN